MSTCAVDANQYVLVIFICISTAAFLAVLGIDLNFLVNGPSHIVRIISNVVNTINEEEIVDEEQLNRVLEEAMWNRSMLIPLIVIAVIAVFIIVANLTGIVAAVGFQTKILVVYSIFVLLLFIPFAALAVYIFALGEDSVMDGFVAGKISEYHAKNNSAFNALIDIVQSGLKCCGFKSSDDWDGNYPRSCCPDKVGDEVCDEEKMYDNGCQKLIWDHLLETDSTIGILGISLLVIVIIMGITAILSCSLTIASGCCYKQTTLCCFDCEDWETENFRSENEVKDVDISLSDRGCRREEGDKDGNSSFSRRIDIHSTIAYLM